MVLDKDFREFRSLLNEEKIDLPHRRRLRRGFPRRSASHWYSPSHFTSVQELDFFILESLD